MKNEPTRVLVVEDHQVVAEGLAALINDQKDMKVVGHAGSVAESLTRNDEIAFNAGSLTDSIVTSCIRLHAIPGRVRGVARIAAAIHESNDGCNAAGGSKDADDLAGLLVAPGEAVRQAPHALLHERAREIDFRFLLLRAG